MCKIRILVTSAIKRVAEDNFNEGEICDLPYTVFDNICGKVFDSVESIANALDLTGNMANEWVYIPESRILSYNRMEDEEGMEVQTTDEDPQYKDFKAGLQNLFSATYDISFKVVVDLDLSKETITKLLEIKEG
jgi:hypothetical protein